MLCRPSDQEYEKKQATINGNFSSKPSGDDPQGAMASDRTTDREIELMIGYLTHMAARRR